MVWTTVRSLETTPLLRRTSIPIASKCPNGVTIFSTSVFRPRLSVVRNEANTYTFQWRSPPWNVRAIEDPKGELPPVSLQRVREEINKKQVTYVLSVTVCGNQQLKPVAK